MPRKSHGKTNSSAVTQQRAPKEVEADDPLTALYRTLDFFPTPLWAGRAGAEIILALDPTAKLIREPACGEMHMAAALEDYFEVWPSDVFPHQQNTPLKDWLDPTVWADEPDCDWIVTNPPFGIAEDFVRLGLKRARRGVALLLRIAFLETEGRYVLLDGPDARLTLLSTFCERVPMTLGKWDPSKGTASCYAWFVWMRDAEPLPPRWIAPGTRDRLTKASDVRLYGWKPPAPLLDFIEGGERSRIIGDFDGGKMLAVRASASPRTAAATPEGRNHEGLQSVTACPADIARVGEKKTAERRG